MINKLYTRNSDNHLKVYKCERKVTKNVNNLIQQLSADINILPLIFSLDSNFR